MHNLSANGLYNLSVNGLYVLFINVFPHDLRDLYELYVNGMNALSVHVHSSDLEESGDVRSESGLHGMNGYLPRALGGHSAEAYRLRMTGVRQTYRYWIHHKILLPRM